MKHKQYQVLVDMHDMARISWDKWSMFTTPLQGTVAFNDDQSYVGLMLTPMTVGADVKTIAELDYNRGLNGEVVLQLSEEETKTDTKGWALVETEPIKYSLEDVVFHTEKIVSEEMVSLGEVNLQREAGFHWEDDWAEMSENIVYRWSGYEAWGTVGGMVRGLATYLHLGDRDQDDIEDQKYFKWGLHSTPAKTERVSVAYSLQPGTRVNVSVTGSRVRLDTLYTCILHCVYRDGSLRTHNISSVMSREKIVNITQYVAGPVFVESGAPAPTTSTTTTTTEMPDTTTPTPQAHMFKAPSPTPTLFPPPPPPVTR